MAKGGFPGMGGGNIAQMMKQAQKMQQDIARIQEDVGNQEFEASVGGGVVKAIITGKKEFKSIIINPECVDSDDVEMLQDLVLSAVNEAINTADEAMASAMESVTGGLNIGL